MISDEARENGPTSASTVASGRPLSDNPEAKRKREARAAKAKGGTSVGGRGGGESSKGNPLRPGDVGVHMGEPISKDEAKRQLFYGHVGLAKAIRSNIDLRELDEEFDVAGENYAYVANHIWTPLRVVIRFIAPVVLVAVLVVIWGHMIAATPWINNVRDWWSRRRGSEESAPPPPTAREQTARPPAEPLSADGAGGTPPEAPAVPPIPRRPHVVRAFPSRRL